MEPQEVIKQARFNKGLTQSDVAKKLGISLRMYQRYEQGKFPKYKEESISFLDQVLGTDIYTKLYDKPVSHSEMKPSNILTAAAVNITLQDYLDLQKQMIQQLNEDKEKLYGIINSGLAKISKDQQYALAYQKAWVDREAEKESGGDKQKKNQIKAKMGKLVDGFLPPDETGGSQSQ